ncbi:MAG TPA: hypothetical protein VN843_24430, partial [Anaerolineales bacterium]|nr:hypothetical protein [Anaerolineales bacterium]
CSGHRRTFPTSVTLGCSTSDLFQCLGMGCQPARINAPIVANHSLLPGDWGQCKVSDKLRKALHLAEHLFTIVLATSSEATKTQRGAKGFAPLRVAQK